MGKISIISFIHTNGNTYYCNVYSSDGLLTDGLSSSSNLAQPFLFTPNGNRGFYLNRSGGELTDVSGTILDGDVIGCNRVYIF